jgi:betaine-aldehyde dehydrogenase
LRQARITLSAAKVDVLFPADQSVNAELSTATLEDVNEAIEKADQAWRQPSWRNSLPHELNDCTTA